jgi:hypothetical protein
MAKGKIATIEAAWGHLAAGELDELASLYSEDMIFVLPGQNDVLNDRDSFRAALEGISSALPPGFEISGLLYFDGQDGVMNVVRWTSEKVPEGSQSAIFWGFDDAGKISEERWFVDTEQWKASF